MKTLKLLPFLFLSTTLFSQTTLDEYNYVTKGYLIQRESGLDMNADYSVTYVGAHNRGVQCCILYALYRSDHTIAAYMVEYLRTDTSQHTFYCFPHPSSDQSVKDLFWSSLVPDQAENYSEDLQMILFTINQFVLKWS